MNIYVASLADSCLAMSLIAKTRDLTTFGQISMNSLWGPPGPITVQLQEAQRSLEGEQGVWVVPASPTQPASPLACS